METPKQDGLPLTTIEEMARQFVIINNLLTRAYDAINSMDLQRMDRVSFEIKREGNRRNELAATVVKALPPLKP